MNSDYINCGEDICKPLNKWYNKNNKRKCYGCNKYYCIHLMTGFPVITGFPVNLHKTRKDYRHYCEKCNPDFLGIRI